MIGQTFIGLTRSYSDKVGCTTMTNVLMYRSYLNYLGFFKCCIVWANKELHTYPCTFFFFYFFLYVDWVVLLDPITWHNGYLLPKVMVNKSQDQLRFAKYKYMMVLIGVMFMQSINIFCDRRYVEYVEITNLWGLDLFSNVIVNKSRG